METVPAARRLLVLANPRIARRAAGLVDAVKAALPEGSGLQVVDGPAAMADQARNAAREGFERVAVLGGDGTVGHVLRALMSTQTPIAIIPAGTYNNFATSLGIPTDPAEAVRLALEGEPRGVDLGQVTSTQPPTSFVFKEMVGVGVDALAFGGGVDVAGPAKIPVGALAAMSAIVSFRPHPVRFSCDLDRRFSRCTQLIIANTPRYGPSLPVVPEADPTDGLLHVLARTWRGRIDLLFDLPQIFKGRHSDLEHDFFTQARTVHIKGSSRILMHADGEFFCRLPASVEVLPHAVRVICPS